MSKLFESFGFLNRGWDVRALENWSPRSLFVALLIDMFMLGALSFMLIYRILHSHHFDWTALVLILGLILPIIRYSKLIYKRLV